MKSKIDDLIQDLLERGSSWKEINEIMKECPSMEKHLEMHLSWRDSELERQEKGY